jgi:NCS1 family nucleobase:cation symporter-1
LDIDMGVEFRKWANRLQCPVDEDAGYVNDRWTNRDLIPIPPERRTYKVRLWRMYLGVL